MLLPVPQGFSFSSLSAGFKKHAKPDLALCLSDRDAVAAATFTTNAFQAAPVLVGKRTLEERETVRAVCINSGQANACTGEQGLEDCLESRRLLAESLGIAPEEILPGSTGVIGVRMDMERWRQAAPLLAEGVGKSGAEAFSRAIMTTDAYPKLSWRQVPCGEAGEVRLLGMAKGAGMICPNMATMLAVVLCDAVLPAPLWREMLQEAVAGSFNRITVDGDTSTNDTVYALANGASGIQVEGGDLDCLGAALADVCMELASLIVSDAEGGTKVMRISVTGAATDRDADTVARAVGNSPLVKTAMFGRDPNWGRIVAAVGRSGVAVDPQAVTLEVNGVPLFRNGMPVTGSTGSYADKDTVLAASMRRQEITLDIHIGDGEGSSLVLASDLGHEYISINAEYTT